MSITINFDSLNLISINSAKRNLACQKLARTNVTKFYEANLFGEVSESFLVYRYKTNIAKKWKVSRTWLVRYGKSSQASKGTSGFSSF